MDFSLTEEQQAWQLKARDFAERELRPISLQRDRIGDPRETFSWDVIKKGSSLGFRTAVVAKEWGGHGIDFVTQALVMNFAADVIQRVTALNLDIHAGAGAVIMDAAADKLARDAVMWTHLAGDSVQRMKAVRKH